MLSNKKKKKKNNFYIKVSMASIIAYNYWLMVNIFGCIFGSATKLLK